MTAVSGLRQMAIASLSPEQRALIRDALESAQCNADSDGEWDEYQELIDALQEPGQ